MAFAAGAFSDMIARISSAFLLLLISSTLVSADASDPANTGHASVWVDPGWRRTVARYAVTFDEQGSSTTVFDFEILALNDKGAEAIAQQIIGLQQLFRRIIRQRSCHREDGWQCDHGRSSCHPRPAGIGRFFLTLFRRNATKDRCLSTRRARRQDQRPPHLQGETADVRRRVRALLDPAGKPAPRDDRIDHRWPGLQAIAHSPSGTPNTPKRG